MVYELNSTRLPDFDLRNGEHRLEIGLRGLLRFGLIAPIDSPARGVIAARCVAIVEDANVVAALAKDGPVVPIRADCAFQTALLDREVLLIPDAPRREREEEACPRRIGPHAVGAIPCNCRITPEHRVMNRADERNGRGAAVAAAVEVVASKAVPRSAIEEREVLGVESPEKERDRP